MNLKDTYNRIAEDWHKDHLQDDWWVEGTNKFISFFAPNAEILDVGCGSGFKAKYLSEHGLHVTGIDFSDALIEIAKREVPHADFFVMDMKEVRTIAKQFDGIFAQASLLHIPHDEIGEVIKSLISKLKENGYLYVAVKGTHPDGPNEEIKEENDYGYRYERFFSYFNLEELKAYYEDANLKIVYENMNRVGNTDWLQLIGRK
jgi:SAM-dependent methyltransferase